MILSNLVKKFLFMNGDLLTAKNPPAVDYF